jgi:hypothetical protein
VGVEDALPAVGCQKVFEGGVVPEVVGPALHAALVKLFVVWIKKPRVLKEDEVCEGQLRANHQLLLLLLHDFNPIVRASFTKNLAFV